ncbi:MAG: hypothetical protein K6357_04990 [Elusimicrobiota bacterium]
MKLNRKLYILLFAFCVVLIVTYAIIEKKYSARSVVTPFETDYAANAIAQARVSLEDIKRRNIEKINISSKDVYETEAIKLIKNKNFIEVAEKELDPMTRLAEMAKSKNKVYVNLKESDLNKKINLYDNIKKSEKINTVVVPDIGKEFSNITPIYAPCDYKIFTTSNSWSEFISHNRVRENIAVDFEKEKIAAIISKSELAPGIFKIDSVKIEKNKATIFYRVDIFELSEDNKNSKRDFHSATKIPKTVNIITLQQIQ